MRKLDLTNEYQRTGLSQLDHIMRMLKLERLARGMTQVELARISGISVSTISKYERGLFPTRLVWFAAMCEALGYKIDLGDG